jgi:hypothetical protein
MLRLHNPTQNSRHNNPKQNSRHNNPEQNSRHNNGHRGQQLQATHAICDMRYATCDKKHEACVRKVRGERRMGGEGGDGEVTGDRKGRGMQHLRYQPTTHRGPTGFAPAPSKHSASVDKSNDVGVDGVDPEQAAHTQWSVQGRHKDGHQKRNFERRTYQPKPDVLLQAHVAGNYCSAQAQAPPSLPSCTGPRRGEMDCRALEDVTSPSSVWSWCLWRRRW